MFPTLKILPMEREEVERDFREKLFPHTDDVDGVQPYDWREEAALSEAQAQGFIEDVWTAAAYYTFLQHRRNTVRDPAQPEWEQCRLWLLRVLALPPQSVPVRMPTYDADAFATWRALGDADAPFPMGGEA